MVKIEANSAEQLPARPSLEWLRKTAKQRRGDGTLAEAQLAVARRYGYPSWRKLVAFVSAVSGEGDRLRAAVMAGDIAAVTAILDEEPELVHAAEDLFERSRPSDEPGMTLMHLAVAAGSLAMTQLLVSRGAPLDVRNRGGRLPIHDCFELGRDEIGRYLVEAGAWLDVCAAVAYGEHARLLAILTADPTQANDLSTGNTPLGWAGYACDAAAAEILLAHGAVVDHRAWAPVAMCAATPVARVLLAHGSDPDCPDPDGTTPLHRVIASRLVEDPTELVRLLLDAGANPHRPDQRGRSPLSEALARRGEPAETYFPQRTLGPRRLEEAIRLMQAR